MLSADVAEKLLIEAHINNLVMFAVAVLVRENSLCLFTMGKGEQQVTSNIFVTNLKFRADIS